ncbi:MAG: hypothetical protein QXO71_12555 [Candidatus Jordarchaeaceae archaeon]
MSNEVNRKLLLFLGLFLIAIGIYGFGFGLAILSSTSLKYLPLLFLLPLVIGTALYIKAIIKKTE